MTSSQEWAKWLGFLLCLIGLYSWSANGNSQITFGLVCSVLGLLISGFGLTKAKFKSKG